MNRIRAPFAGMPEFIRTFDELLEIYDDSINVKNQKDFSLEIPLPGLSKENIEVSTSGTKLLIKMKVDEPTGFNKRYQDNYLTYQLSEHYDLKGIEASIKHGLLSINVPLKKTENISIEVK